MTIVREEENGNNGHYAGDVWRGGRRPRWRPLLPRSSGTSSLARTSRPIAPDLNHETKKNQDH
jgi:hypothetical protein